MDRLEEIRKPIGQELENFKALFSFTLQHQNSILQIALQHILNRKGKMMRPILVLLSAKSCGEINDSVLHAAVSLEMLHTASLVHDDVVDESNERRGQSSVNALVDNRAAVLVGDYMLSTSLRHAAQTGSIEVVEWISLLGQTLSDGELQQMSNIKSEELSEAQYCDVIKMKTASLFAACGRIGAKLAGGSEKDIERAYRFGEYVGMCFQVRDDIFDYYQDSKVGKPTGNDMKEGKLTLPVIHVVLQQGAEKWKEIALKVRKGDASEDEIAALVDYTKRAGGIEYAQQTMEKWRVEAMSLLSGITVPEVAESLGKYMDFVLDRRS